MTTEATSEATASPKLHVGVPGAAGRMGRAILRVLAETKGVEVTAAVEREGHAEIGKDVGTWIGGAPLGVAITSSIPAALEVTRVMIDFTGPSATAALATMAAARGVALVIGTTGLGAAEKSAVIHAAARIPIVLSPNMSVGVNVMFGLLEMAARALGDEYDIEIVEAHHRMKKDSPSGTALRMAEILAEATRRDLGSVGVYGRHGDVGARKPNEIGVLAMRGGDVIGDHTAFFLGLGERIEITHKASSRDTFARGAVRAAQWVAERQPGLYDMRDVLGLR